MPAPRLRCDHRQKRRDHLHRLQRRAARTQKLRRPGYCTREQLKVPRGERYELCRSVHAEANAIISAQRRDMVGATIYLVGRDARSGELLHDATSCPMCRRMIINAGIDEVVIRRTEEEFDIVPVQKWIDEDDSL